MEFLLGIGLALPITAATGISAVTGVAQGVSQQRKANEEANNESRSLKFHIDVTVDPSARKKSGARAAEVDGGMIVLRNDKLYIAPKSKATRQPADEAQHPFTGFFLTYPDDDRPLTRGLVSTISRDPPMLNWIYVDRATHELKYSNRSGSIAHHVGDFDWTDEEAQDSDLTFDGWEGFVAVEEQAAGEAGSQWALYFDFDDDGLKGVRKGRTSLEIQLSRRVITEQEVNQWGIGQQGNIGFKSTREV